MPSTLGGTQGIFSVNHLVAQRAQEHPDYPVLGIPDKELRVGLSTANIITRILTLALVHQIHLQGYR